MTATRVAVPRKGRPLEAVLDALAGRAEPPFPEVADRIGSRLRYEKAVATGAQTPDSPVYDRLAAASDTGDPFEPEFTLLRDARDGMPRRIVFDSVSATVGGERVELIGREEPFRALRKHEFGLGFDSADLVLEEVVELRPEPLSTLSAVNERIDPMDTDVRIVGGLGDTVAHTLLATPDLLEGTGAVLDRDFVAGHEGSLCISPRYERLVEAILGTSVLDGIEFTYTDTDREEEAAIAEAGLGVYLTVTGSTARDHGLVVGEELFPSETVLLRNESERESANDAIAAVFVDAAESDAPAVPTGG